MTRGAGEPSTKRAKVDEADKEEDPLVRRKEELVVAAKEARSREDARAERVARRELSTLCADFEAKNEKLLGRLLPELWQKILDENVQQNDLLAFAMTCRFFREKQKDLGKKVETNLNIWRLLELRKSGEVASHSLGWFQWACDTLEILPGFKDRYEMVKGAVYEGDLVNYAALQGSVEILRWLMEEKGCELNKNTDWSAGKGGSIEVFEYLLERGYEFDRKACEGAARGGCLKALKFLRSQDPPCPWNAETCGWAADGGHLEVLKWLRAQNPPCPWNWETCWRAAEEGHLDVLKWARSQDPPCSWRRSACRESASQNDHQHIVKWIDQQEDESDAEYREYSDSDSDGSYDSYGDDYF